MDQYHFLFYNFNLKIKSVLFFVNNKKPVTRAKILNPILLEVNSVTLLVAEENLIQI